MIVQHERQQRAFPIAILMILALGLSSNAFAQNEGVSADPSMEASSFLTQQRWSPYAVGVGIGVLSWLTFLLSNNALGVSTAYVRTSGMLERAFRGSKVGKVAYFQKYAPKIDWEWMLVAGLVIGSFLSARTSGDFGWEMVPPYWQSHVGDSAAVRWLVALLGGVVMAVGARWAGGCTSGHGISGTLQLAVSSWLATISFFIGGVATAMFLFHVVM